MLCESLILLMLEDNFSKEAMLLAIEDIVDVKQHIAGKTESSVVSVVSIGLLRGVASSISALSSAQRMRPG